MRNILIACSTQEEGERGLRLAEDLSLVSGARVSLVCAWERPRRLAAAAGLDAIGYLSTVALQPLTRRAVWLDQIQARVHRCWDAPDLAEEVARCKPCLVIAPNRDTARDLIARTDAPVWYVPADSRV